MTASRRLSLATFGYRGGVDPAAAQLRYITEEVTLDQKSSEVLASAIYEKVNMSISYGEPSIITVASSTNLDVDVDTRSIY